MPDSINLDIDYFTHPKVIRLAGILGPGSEVHHIRLLCFVAKYRPEDGGFDDWSADEVEGAAVWRGEKGKLVEALIRCDLVRVKKEGYFIHDWKERQPHLVKYEKTKRERKKAAKIGWEKRKPYKKEAKSSTGKEIFADANEHAKRDFASPENGFCITNAVQCSTETTHTTRACAAKGNLDPPPQASSVGSHESNAIPVFEASFSPTLTAVLEIWRSVCCDLGKPPGVDQNTRDGARTLAAAVDASEFNLDDCRGIIRFGLLDDKLPNQGLRGIARNWRKYLEKYQGEQKRAEAVKREQYTPEPVPSEEERKMAAKMAKEAKKQWTK